MPKVHGFIFSKYGLLIWEFHVWALVSHILNNVYIRIPVPVVLTVEGFCMGSVCGCRGPSWPRLGT